MTSLRTRLRAETRDVHDRLDALVAGLDVTRPLAFASFLRFQLAAAEAVLPALPSPSSGRSALLALAEALAADLDRLRGGRPLALQPPGEPLDALGSDWVILGSRMGLRVIRARWAEGRDPRVRAAGDALGLASLTPDWKDLLDRLDATPATGAAADRALAAASAVFALYEQAALAEIGTPSKLSFHV